MFADAVILAPEYQHQGLTSYLRTRKNSGPKDILPGEIIAAPLQPMLRVDLQTWEEDDDTETEALRKWAEKSPYKVGDCPPCRRPHRSTDQRVHFDSRARSMPTSLSCRQTLWSASATSISQLCRPLRPS